MDSPTVDVGLAEAAASSLAASMTAGVAVVGPVASLADWMTRAIAAEMECGRLAAENERLTRLVADLTPDATFPIENAAGWSLEYPGKHDQDAAFIDIVGPSGKGYSTAVANLGRFLAVALADGVRLTLENDTLRKLNTGHCDRIAAQSDLLSRAAARSESGRLDAWQRAAPGRVYRIQSGESGRLFVLMRDGVSRCVIAVADDESALTTAERQAYGECLVCCGKDASLGKCIMVALGEWERKYGKDGG